MTLVSAVTKIAACDPQNNPAAGMPYGCKSPALWSAESCAIARRQDFRQGRVTADPGNGAAGVVARGGRATMSNGASGNSSTSAAQKRADRERAALEGAAMGDAAPLKLEEFL